MDANIVVNPNPELQAALAFMKTHASFDFAALTPEQLLEKVKEFDRHFKTIKMALNGLKEEINDEKIQTR